MKVLVTSLFLLSIFTSCSAKTLTNCVGLPEYSSCSLNKECGCLQLVESIDDSGICGLITLDCPAMSRCSSHGKSCHDHNHICIRHPICDFQPLCYPLNKATHEICPPFNKTLTTTSRPIHTTSIKPYHPSCDWTRDGVIVLNQLKNPTGLFFDNNDDDGISIYVADTGNHRIIKWTPEQSINSPVTVFINGTNQLSYPRDIVINKKDKTMFICDKGNQRIVQWTKNSTYGQTLLTHVECESLIMDNEGSLIASELNKDRVTKWTGINEIYSSEEALAGTNGKGSNLNQLNQPRDILIDNRDQSIYISDSDNHRIVKWIKDAKQGIIVAGGNGRGNGTHQLAYPRGIALHPNGDIFIADTNNFRVIRWTPQAKSGTIVIQGDFNQLRQQDQSPQPFGLTFDQNYHNLYVTDWVNSRLFRFYIDGMGNCVTIT